MPNLLSDYAIQEVADWRLGAAANMAVADWRSSGLTFDDGRQLAHARAVGLAWTDGGLEYGLPKSCEAWDFKADRKFLNMQSRLQRKFGSQLSGLSIFFAFQDARMRASYHLADPMENMITAQLTDARLKDDLLSYRGSQIILWPGDNELAPTQSLPEIAWNDRKLGLFWRGSISGSRFDFLGNGNPIFGGFPYETIFLTSWLRKLGEGTATDWSLHEKNYQRLLVLEQTRFLDNVDVKLVDWAHGSGAIALNYLRHAKGNDAVADRLDRESYLRLKCGQKFILAIEGNDRPSSLREDLLSGSCLLLPKPKWESTAHYGLKAGVHYVELKADLSDLADKWQWCMDHEADAKWIAEAAQQHAREYLNPAVETQVQAQMIDRLRQATVRL